MSDLISREAAIKLILSGRVGDDSPVECPEECNSMLEWAADGVSKMPAAEKVGKWIKHKDGYYRCSECGSRGSAIKAHYCHHCGSRNYRMRGEEG